MKKSQKQSKNTKKGKTKNSPVPFWQQFLFVIIGIAALVLVASAIFEETPLFSENNPETITIGQLASKIPGGSIENITVRGNKITVVEFVGELKGETFGEVEQDQFVKYVAKKDPQASLEEILTSSYGVSPEDIISSNIEIKNESGLAFWLMSLSPILIPIIILIGIIWFLSRSMKGGVGGNLLGESRTKRADQSKKQLSFKDVAGNESAKQELMEVVEFLKTPKKFMLLGAKIPKGVLLAGEPGTGKTLLAKAVAGEAGVPFFYMSGAEFEEMLVGVGASRVRDLFNQAKEAAPAIIFIDEIDAIGKKRGGSTGSNNYHEQTLHQILTEMDGFESNERVIIMGATNRADTLDKALMRPGRFDRHVVVDLPDRKDRIAILKIHSRKKPLADDVAYGEIGKRTPGFSGADLESLMNEAAIRAARLDQKKIFQIDIIKSIEKVMIGPERKNHLHSEKERKLTAYHEAGHAIVASALEHADPVHKVTIIPRGRAGGYTLKLPLEERKLNSKKQFLDDIAMSMGGYVAEQMIMGDVTTGPSNDLQTSTRLARSMVTRWGMSDKIGVVALEGNNGQALFGAGVHNTRHSDRHEEMIDNEVSAILNNAKGQAETLLEKYKDALEAVTAGLLEHETLEQEQYEEIIKPFGLPVVSRV